QVGLLPCPTPSGCPNTLNKAPIKYCNALTFSCGVLVDFNILSSTIGCTLVVRIFANPDRTASLEKMPDSSIFASPYTHCALYGWIVLRIKLDIKSLYSIHLAVPASLKPRHIGIKSSWPFLIK